MAVFIGVERKAGTYEGRAYDNHVVHLIMDDPTPALQCGKVTAAKKVKTSDWPLVFDSAVQPGDEVDLTYNQYGNITRITKKSK